ncbi:MAG: hypothetical protein Q8P90_05310 [bacterium]|nr:hypothetical protein [bacterium]
MELLKGRNIFLILGTIVLLFAFSIPANAQPRKTLNEYDQVIQNETQLGGIEVSEAGALNSAVVLGGPLDMASQIINLLLGLLGTISVIFMFYAGWLWMIARGNQDQVKKAKDILTGTVIGLFFILASYTLLNFVFRSLVTITN